MGHADGAVIHFSLGEAWKIPITWKRRIEGKVRMYQPEGQRFLE